MKLSKIIYVVFLGLLMVACDGNASEPKENPQPEDSTRVEHGQLDESVVRKFVPYKKGQNVIFSNHNFYTVKYTVNDVAQTKTDSTLSIVAKMKGVDFDGVDYYNIEVAVTCTNKKRVDASFTYTFKMNESLVYTQSGTFKYIDKENTGEYPTIITLSNKDNLEVAQLINMQGIQYYLDNDEILFTLYHGTVNW